MNAINNVAACADSMLAEYKYRPILFSAPMVRAILAGNKTQTRRVVKPQPIQDARFVGGWKVVGKGGEESATCSPLVADKSPYGQPGDRLWVREAWNGYGPFKDGMHYYYRATDQNPDSTKWKPSIHMPRAASRITLEITGVRVERLQDISEADAQAEGLIFRTEPSFFHWSGTGKDWFQAPVHAYRDLWESINGPGSWDANPWVWVVEFKRVEGGAA